MTTPIKKISAFDPIPAPLAGGEQFPVVQSGLTYKATINDVTAAVTTLIPDATESVKGIAELATQAETDAGTNDTTIITPLKLQGKIDAIPSSTETTEGLIEIATQAETDTGTDDLKAITPLKLQTKLNDTVVPATETAAGIAELATQAETDTGTDDTKIVTPLKLQSKVATETAKGIIELATQAEVTAGTNDTDAVTPLKLQTKIDALDLGSKVLLASQVAAADATIDFTNITGYDRYELELIGITPSNNAVNLSIRLSNDNGATFNSLATDYRYALSGRHTDNGTVNDNNSADSQINLTGGQLVGNGADQTANARLIISNLASTTKTKHISSEVSYDCDSAGRTAIVSGTGSFYGNTLAVDAIRIFFSAGTIANGTLKLYGIK